MRVLHVMVYDGPGGYCRVIYDLCRFSQRSTPSVAVFAERTWTSKLRGLGIRVASVDRIMMQSSLAARIDGLAKLTRDVDLVNIHVGPHFDDALQGFAELGAPHVYTLHWPLRLPVHRRTIICTSRWLAGLQRPSNVCHTIENGIDVREYRPPARPPARPVLIRVCRPERCAYYFWDAVLPVLRRHPEARLWLVGEDGHSTDQVVYMGYRDDVPALLRRASVLVYTPRHNEGAFDLSILEAMASGVVPVVTDVECTGGAIGRGAGVLVDYGDVNAFEHALERVLRRPSWRARMARAARARVEDRYDARNTARRYERVYARVLR